jgi:DNA modification methylase
MQPQVPSLFAQNQSIADKFSLSERIVVYPGDCLEMLRAIPAESIQLIVTSPPYNIGKEYEKRLHLDLYFQQQAQVITECVRTLAPTGSICWQVGNMSRATMLRRPSIPASSP